MSEINMLSNQPSVFLLGTSGCNGLGVLRCFGRRRIPVYLFDEVNSVPHKLSRYCKYIRCPNFNIDNAAAAELILDYAVKDGSYPVLVSTSDRTAIYEMRYRHFLGGSVRFTSSDELISQRLIRKDLFWRAAKEAGVPYPTTFEPKSLFDAKKALEEVGYPAIIKPGISNVFVRAFGTKCFVVKCYEELEMLWPKVAQLESPVVIQEVIPGNRIYMWYGYYNRASKIVASCGYKKIRQYPPRVGSGSLVMTEEIPELIEMADRLIRHIGYQGIVEPEFKYDERNSTWKILEINARTSTQNRLAAIMGQDMEYLAYCEATGLPMRIRRDVSSHLWTESHFDLASAVLDPDVTLGQWRASRKGKKVYANFCWDDPLPALALLNAAMRVVASAFMRRYMPVIYRSIRPGKSAAASGLELT